MFDCAGRKEWLLFDAEQPKKFQSKLGSCSTFDENDVGALTGGRRIVMEPGDVLYLPRKVVHSARTIGDVASVHLTLGVGGHSDSGENCESERKETAGPAADSAAAMFPLEGKGDSRRRLGVCYTYARCGSTQYSTSTSCNSCDAGCGSSCDYSAPTGCDARSGCDYCYTRGAPLSSCDSSCDWYPRRCTYTGCDSQTGCDTYNPASSCDYNGGCDSSCNSWRRRSCDGGCDYRSGCDTGASRTSCDGRSSCDLSCAYSGSCDSSCDTAATRPSRCNGGCDASTSCDATYVSGCDSGCNSGCDTRGCATCASGKYQSQRVSHTSSTCSWCGSSSYYCRYGNKYGVSRGYYTTGGPSNPHPTLETISQFC